MANRECGTRTIPTNWAVEVASRMKGAHVPMGQEDAYERLSGLEIQGRGIFHFLRNVDFPLETPAELLHEISDQVSATKGTPGDNWAINVARAVKGADFPLSREEAWKRLRDIDVRGRDVREILVDIDFPLDTPADLLREVARCSR